MLFIYFWEGEARFYAAALIALSPTSFCTKALTYSFLQRRFVCDVLIKPLKHPIGHKHTHTQRKDVHNIGKRKEPHLAGRWSWGRLNGVQIGSPTNSRIACINVTCKKCLYLEYIHYTEKDVGLYYRKKEEVKIRYNQDMWKQFLCV